MIVVVTIEEVYIGICVQTLADTIGRDLEFRPDFHMESTGGKKGLGVAVSARTGTAIVLDGVGNRGELKTIVHEEENDLDFTTKRMRCGFWNVDLPSFGETIPIDPATMV